MKKIFIVITTVIAVFTMFVCLTACNGKTETEPVYEAKTIEISNSTDLYNVRNYLGKSYQNYTFVLQEDIDLDTFENWTPIGSSIENAFCGTFDGNGKTISNLKFRGWDENGLPIVSTLGKIDGKENTTSFSTMALFGYSDTATFKNVKIRDIDFQYYADTGYSYVAGLVAYNKGASTFEDIDVSGNIDCNNVYTKKYTYDNKGVRQNPVYTCDVTIYSGGINAYNSGDAKFNNVRSTVDFVNKNYRAYLYNLENAEIEDIENGTVEERYIADSSISDSNAAPYQLFVGGVCGVMKSGTIQNATYAGNISAYGKSVYAGGILAAGYAGGTAENNSASNVKMDIGVHIKSAIGGVIALADNFDLSKNSATKLTIKTYDYTAAQSMNLGGIFAFGCNMASIKDNTVTETTIEVDDYKKACVGGIGGTIRDASVESNSCQDIKFVFGSSGGIVDAEELKTIFAGVVNAIYNNSTLYADNTFDAQVKFGKNEFTSVEEKYWTVTHTSYVDEDGNKGIRLFEKGRTDKFIYVFATAKSDSVMEIELFDEELTSLATASYNMAEGFAKDASGKEYDNLAEEYRDVFFAAGSGFVTPSDGSIDIAGRNLNNYEYRSGEPIIE